MFTSYLEKPRIENAMYPDGNTAGSNRGSKRCQHPAYSWQLHQSLSLNKIVTQPEHSTDITKHPLHNAIPQRNMSDTSLNYQETWGHSLPNKPPEKICHTSKACLYTSSPQQISCLSNKHFCTKFLLGWSSSAGLHLPEGKETASEANFLHS